MLFACSAASSSVVVAGVSCRNRVTPPALHLGHLHRWLLLLLLLLLCVSGCCVLRHAAHCLLCRHLRLLLGQHHYGLLLRLRHHRVELLGSAGGGTDLSILLLLRHSLRLLLSHQILRLRHVLLDQRLLLRELVELRLILLGLSQKLLGLLLERLLKRLLGLELA